MNEIWEEDYKEVLKDLPKNAWVAWSQESEKDFVKWGSTEFSVVHTGEPHGLISYGWDGPMKIYLLEITDFTETIPKGKRKTFYQRMMENAKGMAMSLNKTAPMGLL